MASWKEALENSSISMAVYPYAEVGPGYDQPQVEGIPGDIQEILIKEEGKGYIMIVTVLVDGVSEDGVSEDEITARLRELVADPNNDWEE